MTGVRSLAETKDFLSSLCVKTSSEAHSASCPMGTRGSFPKGKAQLGHDTDHSPPPNAKVKIEYELFIVSPLTPV
jgi:hypothetical protein